MPWALDQVVSVCGWPCHHAQPHPYLVRGYCCKSNQFFESVHVCAHETQTKNEMNLYYLKQCILFHNIGHSVNVNSHITNFSFKHICSLFCPISVFKPQHTERDSWSDGSVKEWMKSCQYEWRYRYFKTTEIAFNFPLSTSNSNDNVIDTDSIIPYFEREVLKICAQDLMSIIYNRMNLW